MAKRAGLAANDLTEFHRPLPEPIAKAPVVAAAPAADVPADDPILPFTVRLRVSDQEYLKNRKSRTFNPSTFVREKVTEAIQQLRESEGEGIQ